MKSVQNSTLSYRSWPSRQEMLRALELSGRDPYGITAALAAEAVKILMNNEFTTGVVLTPGEAFLGHGLLKNIISKFNLNLSVTRN